MNSGPPLTMTRLSPVPFHDKDPDLGRTTALYDTVWKDRHGHAAQAAGPRSANFRMTGQQRDYAPKFAARASGPSFS